MSIVANYQYMEDIGMEITVSRTITERQHDSAADTGDRGAMEGIFLPVSHN